MSSILNPNFDQNIICPDCSCIPLLGINYSYEKENLSDVCELYSYCFFDHNKKDKTIQKYSLETMFKNKSKKKNKKINYNVICESCKKKNIEYHCIECQRNICKKCFENHKAHKYYDNKKYIPEKELKEIKNKLEESKKNIQKNLDLINEKINEYESQLNELKSLYEKYKDINDKLFSFSEYILKLYTDLSESKEDIYYPLYFNVKNILSFNPKPIKFEENDIQLKSFINILNGKLISGFYFILTNSDFSKNLNEYNNLEQKIIKYDSLDIDKFTKKNVQYEKMMPFADNKIIGTYDNNKDIDVFNIKNQSIETTLNISPPEKIFYNKQYPLLIFLSPKTLYILNSRDYSIKQEFSATHLIKKEKKEEKRSWYGSSFWSRDNREYEEEYECPGKFIHAEILSENSFAIVFDGDIRRLGEEYGKFFRTDGMDVVNSESRCYRDNRYRDYFFLIIYEIEKDIFVPKKFFTLVKRNINTDEVSYVTGKHIEVEEDDYPYCTFNFNSMTKISEDTFIFGFKSKIVADRDQDYYYITEKNYQNENIYYPLNIKEDKRIKSKLIITKEKSLLFKNENDGNFYFFYDVSDNHPSELISYFSSQNLEMKAIKYYKQKNNIRNIFVQKNSIIGMDDQNIFFAKIINETMETIYVVSLEEKQEIKFVSLEEKYIFYGKSKKPQIEGNQRRTFRERANKNSENEESSEENRFNRIGNEDSENEDEEY